MKKHYLFYLLLLGLSLSGRAQSTTYVGDFAADQSYTIPDNGTITITARGADGGGSNVRGKGGSGAVASATFVVQKDDVLTIVVGISGKTSSGGGMDGGSGGGGGSAVLITRSGIITPLVFSGGGGGAGKTTSSTSSSGGGGGLGTTQGGPGLSAGSGGGGGGYVSGITGGSAGGAAGGTGGTGGFGLGSGGGGGGNGGSDSNSGGGGGGGYLGGIGGSLFLAGTGGFSFTQSTGSFVASNPSITVGATGGGTNKNGIVTINFIAIQPTLGQPVVTNANCKGGSNGSISASATKGTPPYTFSLSPTTGTQSSAGNFTGLTAGTYTLTVTDANQKTNSKQVTVGEPTAVTFTATPAMPKCNGGSDGNISVSPSGGTGQSYTYSIDGKPYVSSSTFTGLSAGTYDIKVKDANQCESAAQSITVTEPTVVTFTATTTMPKCNGGSDGSISVSASGGTSDRYPRYTYSIDGGGYSPPPSFNGLNAGTYSIRVKDVNGCESEVQSVDVNQPTAVTFTTTTTMPKCNGGSDGSITVVADGGTPGYTYAKDDGEFGSSPTFTSLSAGTYAIKVRDANGCETVAQSVIVSEPTAVSVTTGPDKSVIRGFGGPNSTCTDLSANASGGTPDYTYTWTPGNLSGPTPNVCPLETTTYTVTATDANGCTATATQTVNVQDARCGPGNKNVSICYYGVTQCVSEKIAARYLKLGATLGGCGSTNNGNKRIGAEEVASAPLQLTLKAFPNPVADLTTLEILAPRAGEATIEVLDLTGRARQTRREVLVEGLNEIELRLGTLNTGIYLIRAVDAAGRQGVTKVSKQ